MPTATPEQLEPMPAWQAARDLWQGLGLPSDALAMLELSRTAPVLPSSFAVATAAQASLGAAALAAAELWQLRGSGPQRQHVTVPREHAVLECLGWFTVDGREPVVWDKLSGLYPCGADVGQAGWVRIHANFAHHRDGALKILGLPTGQDTEKPSVIQAFAHGQH